MSAFFFLYSLQPINADLFIKSMEAVGVRDCHIDEHSRLWTAQYFNEYYERMIVSLDFDIKEEIDEERLQIVSEKLGGAPKSVLHLEPKITHVLMIEYLSKLADSVDFVLQPNPEDWLTGKDFKQMRKEDWELIDGPPD